VVRSVEDLKASIAAFLTAWNKDPKPFVWTATMESIMEKLSRCRADVGEDPARLHQSPEPETKEIAAHLFRGHYTSVKGMKRRAAVDRAAASAAYLRRYA
jgi:hypothetical protein